MMQVIDNSLNKGYTVAWGADVSHKGFAYSKGIAVIPDMVIENTDGLEKGKWEKLSEGEKKKLIYGLDKPGKEMKITQEMRQEAFDNYTTTDDHGMLIIGIANDQNGNKYYIIKNSWSDSGIYKGYFYASEAFVKMQTMDIMIHKDVISKSIKSKLDLK